MTATLPKTEQPQPDETARQVEANTAETAFLADRVARLEMFVGKICVALGTDPPPPTVGEAWSTIKAVAFDSGFSESSIRLWLDSGKIDSFKRGGHVFVNVASAKLFLERKQHRAHKAGS
jgi:hypothetical protein